jgi:hypothetical protein
MSLPIDPTTNQAAYQALSEAANQELVGLMHDLYAHRITVEQWEVSSALTLKDATVASGIYGAGGTDNIGSVGYGRIGGNFGDELRYLDGFAKDIAAGNVSEAQAVARIQQYGRATEQAYWREFGDKANRPEWAGLPVLNQVPRDGDTPCLGNCNCQIRVTDKGLMWDLYPGEHCESKNGKVGCVELAAGGPYRPGSL